MKATLAITHELAQQQVRDAVASTMLFADHKHEEVVKLLKQTHNEELMAVKAGHEKESVKETSAVKAEVEVARAQQREAAKRAGQEATHRKEELVAKEAQLGELQAANTRIAGDLRVKEEAYNRLESERDQLKSERDGLLTAGERLQTRYDRLKTEADELVRDLKVLEDDNIELKEAADYLAGEGKKFQQEIEQLKDDNRGLLENNTELLCQTVVSDLDLRQTRGRVGNLERQVADLETADITVAVSGMGTGGAQR